MTADSRQLGADARIAREFGCSKNTVRRYVSAAGWMAYSRRLGGGKLEDQEAWLKEPLLPAPQQCRGGAPGTTGSTRIIVVHQHTPFLRGQFSVSRRGQFRVSLETGVR